MYCVQVIKPELFLGLSGRSGRYWLLVLKGTGTDRDFHPYAFMVVYLDLVVSWGALVCS